jgi:flagellar motor switch protein FliM
MPAPVDATVLRRKIAAHARPHPKGPDPREVAMRGLDRALRHAAAPFDGLGLAIVENGAVAHATLEGAVAALPTAGLVAVLEDEGGARGLVALSPGMVDALVEVQTTGRVERAELPERPVTRIDEALVRDFLDFTLAAFARETADAPGRTWPARMAYASRIRDRGQIGLLLPEGAYLSLNAETGFEGTPRRAHVAMVLPARPGAARDAAAPPPAADAAWCLARKAMVDRLPLPLEAVLLRVTRPLREVEGLTVGALIPFGAATLGAVTLETGAGAAIVRGRLGRSGGYRALRLSGAARPPPAPVPAPPPAPARVMPEGGAPVPTGAPAS